MPKTSNFPFTAVAKMQLWTLLGWPEKASDITLYNHHGVVPGFTIEGEYPRILEVAQHAKVPFFIQGRLLVKGAAIVTPAQAASMRPEYWMLLQRELYQSGMMKELRDEVRAKHQGEHHYHLIPPDQPGNDVWADLHAAYFIPNGELLYLNLTDTPKSRAIHLRNATGQPPRPRHPDAEGFTMPKSIFEYADRVYPAPTLSLDPGTPLVRRLTWPIHHPSDS